MEAVPVVLVLGSLIFIVVTLLVLSTILDFCILEPRPKKDVFTSANVWPLVIPEEYLSKNGKRYRRIGFKVVMGFVSIAIISIAYMAFRIIVGL